MAERRSARANKGARYKEYVSHGRLNFFWEKEKPPVRHMEPTYPRKRTLKYILEQAAELPEIGEPDAEVYCRLYTTDEIDASLGLLEISREFEEKRIRNQDEIDVALALMELSRTCEELSVTDQAKNLKKKNNSKRRADKTSKSLPKKRAKYF